ncbi:MAG: hypothetical protein HY581_07520 [Nitrospirae bacterium]|nr:hypothetical protein [Nitrospirota bacterium]
MTAEFLQRIRKEVTINLEALREIVIAISERVNRKVQILKLHWQAAKVLTQVESVHRDLGESVCTLLPHDGEGHGLELDRPKIQAKLAEAASRLRQLKKELGHIDSMARELESETVQEDLFKIQYDLAARSASIERVQVVPGAAAIGCSVGQLRLTPTTRVVAIFRGATLLTSLDTVVVQSGDVVVLLGLRTDLKSVVPIFIEKQRATA